MESGVWVETRCLAFILPYGSCDAWLGLSPVPSRQKQRKSGAVTLKILLLARHLARFSMFSLEVKRSRLDMEPISGQEIETIYKELMHQPPAVVDLVKKLDEN